MKFVIDNVSKIKHSDINVNGITVIAGYNNTGKTTILRSIDVMLKSYSNMTYNIMLERLSSVRQEIIKQDSYFDENGFENLSVQILYDISDAIISRMMEKRVDKLSFDEFYNICISQFDKCIEIDRNSKQYTIAVSQRFVNGIYHNIKKVFERSSLDYRKFIIEMNLRNEFNFQATNLINSKPSRIFADNGNNEAQVEFSNNKLLNEFGNEFGNSSIIYLETRNILDNLNRKNFERKNTELQKLLLKEMNDRELTFEDYNETEQNMEALEEIFKEVIHGKSYSESGTIRFLEDNIEQPLDIKNLASGMKNFLILQRLVENGSLSENGWLLIDEPETNLHPEWHLKFAEILILLKIKMNINIVVSSHSPYFIRALEVKLADYKVKNLGEFYLMEESDNYFMAKNVTNSTDEIYKQLYKPLNLI